MADGEAIGLLLVLTYATAAPVITYTGIVDLTARPRDFALAVNAREYDGLDVRARDFALTVEDR